MNETQLLKIYGRASRKRSKLMNNSDRDFDGLKTFMRKALGICEFNKTRTLDEMIQLLFDTNLATTTEEAKSLVPKLVSGDVTYALDKYFGFQEVRNASGDVRYITYTSCSY